MRSGRQAGRIFSLIVLQKEENPVLQSRSAAAVASLVHLCGSSLHAGRPNPSDKVIKNLFTFLCQDTSVNPVFSLLTEGIVSLKEDKPKKQPKAGSATEEEETEEQIAMRVMRRGALVSFEKLAEKFGADLLDKVPKFLDRIAHPLITHYEGEPGLVRDRNYRELGTDGTKAKASIKQTICSRQTSLPGKMSSTH